MGLNLECTEPLIYKTYNSPTLMGPYLLFPTSNGTEALIKLKP
jgi:hypothetical protein